MVASWLIESPFIVYCGEQQLKKSLKSEKSLRSGMLSEIWCSTNNQHFIVIAVSVLQPSAMVLPRWHESSWTTIQSSQVGCLSIPTRKFTTPCTASSALNVRSVLRYCIVYARRAKKGTNRKAFKEIHCKFNYTCQIRPDFRPNFAFISDNLEVLLSLVRPKAWYIED